MLKLLLLESHFPSLDGLRHGVGQWGDPKDHQSHDDPALKHLSEHVRIGPILVALWSEFLGGKDG